MKKTFVTGGAVLVAVLAFVVTVRPAAPPELTQTPAAKQPPPTPQKLPKKQVYVPALKRYVTFTDRRAMQKGHAPRRMHAPLRNPWPAPTLPIDWAKSLSFPILGNDRYGDCMYAAACHADQTMTGNVGTESQFNEQTVIQDYLQLTGGDNGLDDGTLIPAWKQGIGSNPQATIVDVLMVDPTNVQLCQSALQLFGFVFFEFAVPDAWINSFQTGAIWDAPARPDPGNGHGVIWNGVDTRGYYKLQTWGSYVWLTPAGVNDCDPSAFVVFSQRWFNSQGYAPNGKHVTELAATWQAVGGNIIPASVISAYPGPVQPPAPPVPPMPPVPPAPPPGPVPPMPASAHIYLPNPLPAGLYPIGPPITQAVDRKAIRARVQALPVPDKLKAAGISAVDWQLILQEILAIIEQFFPIPTPTPPALTPTGRAPAGLTPQLSQEAADVQFCSTGTAADLSAVPDAGGEASAWVYRSQQPSPCANGQCYLPYMPYLPVSPYNGAGYAYAPPQYSYYGAYGCSNGSCGPNMQQGPFISRGGPSGPGRRIFGGCGGRRGGGRCR